MNDQKLLPTESEPTSLNDTPDDSRALFGKIARLPHDLREQLNHRLLDGQSHRDILAWLNELPSVREILAAQFAGVAVSSSNLSNWRQTGFQRWLRQKDSIHATRDLRKYADDVTEAAGGRLAPAAAELASGKILQFLETADPEKSDPNDLVECAAAAAALQKGEHTKVRLTLAKERLRQRDLLLILKRDKQQRDQVAIGLRLLGDQRAKEIEGSNCSNAEKIELLGIHLFGDLWEPRPVPNPTPHDT